MKKIIFIIFIIVITFITVIHPVHAAVKPMLSVSPAILNIELSPGKTYIYTITVQNRLAVPLPLHTLLDNLGPADSDEKAIQDPSPILSWITLDPTDMIIPAGEAKEVHLKLKLPSKIPLGGYYATLFLEPVLNRKNAYGTAVSAKVGVILLANVGVPHASSENGKILNFTLDKLFYDQGPIAITFGVKNNSLYHFSAKPFIKIRPLLGQEGVTALVEKIVLPGKTRVWNQTIELKDYHFGVYEAKLAVSVGDGQQVIDKTFFIAFPWRVITIIIVITIIFLIFLRKKKSLKKALRILFGKKA